MRVQTRDTALQGEYVRLYAKFIYEGQLADPTVAPIAFITTNDYNQESSSSSTDLTSDSSDYPTVGPGIGPFAAQRESTGVWYIDWLVPLSQPVGFLYDVWAFGW